MRVYRHLFRLISWYYLRRHRGRTLLTLLIMALGTMVMYLGIAAIPTSLAGLTDMVDVLAGEAELAIEAPDAALTAADLAAVREIDGVKSAAPLVTSGGIVLGETDLLVYWGIDPAVERDLRDYVVVEGDFAAEGRILLTADYAAARDFAVGQAIRLVGSAGIYPVTIGGLVEKSGIAALNGGDVIIMHYQDAQMLRGDESLDLISVTTAAGQNMDALTARLQAVLPPDSQIAPPDAYYEKPLAAWVAEGLTLVTALIPAILGGLIIFNSLAATVAQRRSEIGVLRALGLTRGGIRTLFLVESGVLGLIGASLGIALAYIGPASPSTVEVGEYEMEYALAIPSWLPLVGLALGVGIALLAGVIPARRAAQVDPVEAMTRARAARHSPQRRGPRRFWMVFGSLCLISLLPLRAAVDATEQAVLMPLLSVLLVGVGGSVLFPSLLLIFSERLPKLLGNRLGPSVLLAAESLAKRPQSVIATGVMVFISLWFVSIGFAIAGAETVFVDEYMATENAWDLQIVGAGTDHENPLTALPADIVSEISARPAVAGVVTERLANLTYNDHDYTLRGLDITALRAQNEHLLIIDGDQTAVYARLRDHDRPAVLVGGIHALTDGLKQVGTHITLATPAADQPQTEFEVVGVVGGVVNMVVMDRALYQDLWGDARVDRLLIKLRPGVDLQTERRDLLRGYASRGVQVIDRETIAAMFTTSAEGMTILAVLLWPFMVLGVANTVFINILDRRREIGMLRAVGTLRRQIMISLIGETLLLCGIAGLLALPAAFYCLSMMLFDGITGIPVDPTPNSVFMVVIYLLLSSLLATFWPARRAGRLDVLEALHYE